MITARWGLSANVLAATAAVFAYASPAVGQSAQREFSDCRTSKEPNVKVSACTSVINSVKEKSFVERAYNSRGLAYMALKQYQKAVDDFSAAIMYDKKNSGYVDNRQGAYFALGDYKKALDDAELAVKMDPSGAFVYRSRGAIFNEIGQYEKAINDFSAAFKLDPSWVDLLIYRAISFRNLGRMELALDDLNQAIKLNANSLWAYEERGVTYLRMGELDRAKNDFELVIKNDPTNTKVTEYLARTSPRTADSSRSGLPPPSASPLNVGRSSSSDVLGQLEGLWTAEWVAATGGSKLEQVLFYRNALNRHTAALPFLPGLAAITLCQGQGCSGADLAVSGTGYDCLYAYSIYNQNEFAWTSKGGSGGCPPSAKFLRVRVPD